MSGSRWALLLAVMLGTGVGLGSAAQAQRLTAMQASRFFQTCQAHAGQTVCDAYISGVADGVTLTEPTKDAAGASGAASTICIPPSNGNVLREQVVRWLSGHTEALRGQVGPAVHGALQALYPCPAGAGKP